MLVRLNPSSGVPLYLQLIEKVKHAIETGALRPGEQLPPIRKLAEELVMNPNTVVRAYRELEHAGLVELRQGSGAFITESSPRQVNAFRKAQSIAESAVERMAALHLSEEEIRRLFEGELTRFRTNREKEKE